MLHALAANKETARRKLNGFGQSDDSGLIDLLLGGCRPKPAELIRLLKTAESSSTTMRHTDGPLCDTSTNEPKASHIGRHFIKAPQTMAWSDSQHRDWINSAGLGLDPHEGFRKCFEAIAFLVRFSRKFSLDRR